MYALGTGIAGFLGGASAGPLLLGLTRLEGTVLVAPWSAYTALFVIAAVLRLQAWWFLRPLGWPVRRPRGVKGRRRGAPRG
jgi:hypothetical protein